MAIRGLDRQWTLNSVSLYKSVRTKIFIKKSISDFRGTFQLCSFVSSYNCTTMQQNFWFLLNFTQSKHSSADLTSEFWCDWLKDDQHIDISAWRIKQMSRIQIQRHLLINIQQMSWQTDLNHSLQNILFQWICSKFFKFQHWHNSFWPPTSRRLLEAKNSPQRPKMVGRSF